MSSYWLTYSRLAMCSCNATTLKIVTTSIFIKKKIERKIHSSKNLFLFTKIKKEIPAITPFKHMQTLLFYRF